LENFKNDNGLSLILNVHILDEGVNIPYCDSVFIANPSNNIENIVQRMCRCNRIIENKTKSNIFLWCSKNKTNKITSYLFDNIDGINDKIKLFKNMSCDKTNTLKYDHDNIENSIKKENDKNFIIDYELMSNIFNTLKENYIKFKNNNIKVIIDNDDNIWFNGKDVGVTLGYSNTRDAIHKHVDNDDKTTLNKINTDVKKGKYSQNVYLSESGLYSLIFG